MKMERKVAEHCRWEGRINSKAKKYVKVWPEKRKSM